MISDPRYSYSALSDFKACPLRYYLKRVVGLEPRDAASNAHHVEFGKAFHAGLEYLYSGYDEPAYGDSIFIKVAQNTFAEAYPTQLDPLDRAKTQENGIRALKLYVDRWAEEDRNWRVLETEGPGELDYTLDSGLNEVHCDLVVENLAHGGIYVVDHKTTSKALGPWYWDQYSPNSQITYYIDYCQEKYGACEGFIINAISLQWLDEKKSNDANNVKWFALNDPAMPWLAYSHHEERQYRGGPLGKAGPRMVAWGLTVGFERQVFQRSREQVEQERESTRYWKHQIELAKELSKRASSFEPDFGSRVYGFNTSSCYSCYYRGGDSGGICRPGYEWPRDQEIISLGYRQVCREVIKILCPRCGGNGIDPKSREFLRRLASDDNSWLLLETYSLALEICTQCKGVRLVDGPRCVLDRGHTGACAPVLVASSLIEDEIEVAI